MGYMGPGGGPRPALGPIPCGSPGGPTAKGGIKVGFGPDAGITSPLMTGMDRSPAWAIGAGPCPQAEPAPITNAVIEPSIPLFMVRSCSAFRGGTSRHKPFTPPNGRPGSGGRACASSGYPPILRTDPDN